MLMVCSCTAHAMLYLCAFACVKCGGPTTTWTYRMNHHQTAYIFKCYMKLINVMEFNHENCNYSWFTIYGLIRPFYIQISVYTNIHACSIHMNVPTNKLMKRGSGQKEKKGTSMGTAKVRQTCTMLHIHIGHIWGTETACAGIVQCTCTYIRVSVCMWNICWHRYKLIGKLFYFILFYWAFVCVCMHFFSEYIQCISYVLFSSLIWDMFETGHRLNVSNSHTWTWAPKRAFGTTFEMKRHIKIELNKYG